MKKLLYFVILLISNFLNAQTEALPIPGTKFSLIPPEGFVNATNFSGLMNIENGSSVLITELPASYFEIDKALSPEALKGKGMILKSKESVDFNGKKATFIEVSHQNNGVPYFKQILVFGDEHHTVMVNGVYPEEFKTIAPLIKKCLFSITHNETQNDDPLDAVKFTVDVSGTKYKLAKFISGSLLYSEDGEFPSDEGLLMVSASIAKGPESNLKEYSIDRLKKLPNGDKSKIIQVNPITIGDLSGYEIIADGKNSKSEKEMVYQVMLYNKSEYYIIVGQARSNEENNLIAFKKIANTFKLK